MWAARSRPHPLDSMLDFDKIHRKLEDGVREDGLVKLSPKEQDQVAEIYKKLAQETRRTMAELGVDIREGEKAEDVRLRIKLAGIVVEHKDKGDDAGWYIYKLGVLRRFVSHPYLDKKTKRFKFRMSSAF